MFTTTPYLRIRRPSPTTAEFIVSTLPPLTTALRLSFYALYMIRLVVGSLLLLFLYAAWAQSPYGSLPSPNPEASLSIGTLLAAILASRPGVLATELASRSPWILAFEVCALALWAATRRLYTEESLLVLRGLGIQTSSSKGNILAGRATTRFIPTSKIQDIFVNEAFLGFEVRHYLVIVVDDEPDVVVVFPKLLPRAHVVQSVWRGVRECLYERGTVTDRYMSDRKYRRCGGGGAQTY
ncbi:GPI-GlcNAc transferase complex, PIG-H component-domain-containing protein [Xylaria digitata]|nr:GPI-GlcNAc transferase complex, PIG-H component-domain-containing protein [Xylaria digitata]